ncbi:MAG TPA: alpha/beta hydrolase, partial [Candidatus Eisenbacteria bacterium]
LLLVAIAPSAAGCAPPRPRAGHAALNGIRMYYEQYGRGPALILLHGGAGNGMQFSKQIPAFRRRHRLIVPDLCAQGRTTDRPGPLTYHAMAEDVVALMDRLGVRDADLMGWSDGGIVGLDLAIHHPGRLRHLVTFGANFTPDGLDPADVAWNTAATPDSFGPGMREGYQKLSPEPGHYEAAMRKILDMWRTQPRFTPAELGSIRAATLIAAGEHDLVRREHTEQLARAIPGARLWIVPGASHGAMLEQPDLVNRTVLAFLGDLSRP